MTPRPLHLLLPALALAAAVAAANTVAITRSNNGQTIEVTPAEVAGGKVRFSYNGREFTFPLEQLTADSRKRLEAWHEANQQAGPQAAEAVNQAVGTGLFADGRSLWREPAADVAKRLGWPCESVAKASSSYRKYPRPDYRFLGARPYCCTLYGNDEGMAESLSLVFANKGDFNSRLGFGEDHFKKGGSGEKVELTLNEAIRKDVATIGGRLTTALGEPVKQRYGEKEDRRNVLRWDFNDQSFILSEREDEYAHLLVVNRATADSEGKVKFIKDQEVREMLAANVSREDNGDVVITNIPMVNQGPKGYCAPATFERAMRYMRVPADMYLLATLATEAQGGTNTPKLADEAKRIISSKARRIKGLDLQDDLNVRLVKRYVDKGVPVLWQMASLKSYNKTVNELTKKRRSGGDMSQWAAEVETLAEQLAPTLHNTANYHICLIIGYNEATSELAVSDSWGPGYALRWVPVEIAKAVTTRGGFVIDL